MVRSSRVNAASLDESLRMLVIPILVLVCLVGYAPSGAAAPGDTWTQAFEQWQSRYGFSTAVHNNRLWIVGGATTAGLDSSSDVWSSTDGSVWLETTSATPWKPRLWGSSVSAFGKLWVIGGNYWGLPADEQLRKLWSSEDGITWTQGVTAPWSERYGAKCAFNNGKLWVMGGSLYASDYLQHFGDVWSSPDGVTWSQVTASAPWSERDITACISHGGKIWVFATYWDSTGYQTEIWSSPDGISWTLATALPAWNTQFLYGRTDFGCVSHDGKLWVMGGSAGGEVRNDVWSSSDGVAWTLTTPSAAWYPRNYVYCASFDGRLWVIGSGQNLNDVWSSTDGITWIQMGPPTFSGSKAVVHGGEIWLLGGSNIFSKFSQVWRSQDGSKWTSVSPAPPWAERTGHGAIEFGGKMWVLGGLTNGTPARDVWSSSNGAVWNRDASDAPWAPRYSTCAVAYRGKMWLLGGVGEGGERNDVWSSSDGASWSLVNSAAPWERRGQHAAVVNKDRIWVLGGEGRFGALSDVWSTTNGIDWTEATSNAPWGPRASHSVVAADGKMWLMGGIVGTGSSSSNVADLWTSDDGAIWTQASTTPQWTPRANHSSVVFDGKIWVLGGALNSDDSRDAWYTDGIADSDNDGISDVQEGVLGTDPYNADTDGDLMPDGWEVSHGLNPLSAADASGDADNDGPTNLQEYIRGTDPTNASEPAHDLYVDAAAGDDLTGTGATAHPYKSISKALIQTKEIGTAAHPFTIHAAAGTYAEKVNLEPHVRIAGAGAESTIISFYDSTVTDHIVVAAADDTAISDLKVTLPAVAIPAPVVLVSINDVAMDIGNVILDGRFKQLSTGVLASGPNSSGTSVHDSTVMRVRDGVWATDTSMQVTRNVFDHILNDAVFVLVSEKATATVTPKLGMLERTSTTGFNTFRNVTGKMVYNFSNTLTMAEFNDWGVYTEQEIADKVVGAVDYDSFLRKGVAPGSAVVTLFDITTQSLLDPSAAPVIHISGAKSTAELDGSGVYVVQDLPDGDYAVSVTADGYRATSGVAHVTRHSIGAVTLKLVTKAAWVPGDVDLDGKVSATDVQLTINSALGQRPGLDSDLNCSGSVDAVDVQMAINAALGLTIPDGCP